MFRATCVGLNRVPMIQFKYGARDAAPAPAVAVAAAGGAKAAVQIFESAWDLPANLRPKFLAEVEQSTIRFGGCADYELKKKKK